MAAHIRKVTFSVLSRLHRAFGEAKPSPRWNGWNLTNTAGLATTSVRRDLSEFFDDPKNFGAEQVKSGRSWTEDELRLKSNLDLQKLWYVLLKERNMLLTMELECERAVESFPSPERLDKVQDSMKRLESVVRERDQAYWSLEVGESAPQSVDADPQLDADDPLALVRGAVRAAGFDRVTDAQTLKFNYLLKEKERRLRRKQERLHRREAMALLKRFPNLDREALQDRYPDINVDRLLFSKKTRGHHDLNTA